MRFDDPGCFVQIGGGLTILFAGDAIDELENTVWLEYADWANSVCIHEAAHPNAEDVLLELACNLGFWVVVAFRRVFSQTARSRKNTSKQGSEGSSFERHRMDCLEAMGSSGRW